MAQSRDVDQTPSHSPAQQPPVAEPVAQSTPMPQPLALRPSTRRRFEPFSDLDLNGRVPSRVRPAIGEWGPADLPSTNRKRWVRLFTPIIFVVVLGVLVGLAFYFGQFFY
ncbi:hypothetical protein AADG42_08830 [Ammonicoccus fulvus]|uniref:Uncharacterized protein n=1 Tax=Ammonicoccus fulvus TaxID=3138240 RepID=A0ABZ3FRL5_9ACTN